MLPVLVTSRTVGFSVVVLTMLGLTCSGSSLAANAQDSEKSTKVFAGAQIQEIYRVNLDRDDGLLEGINAAVKQYGIQDGAVLTTVGSTQECTYHYVESTAAAAKDVFVTQKGAAEILSVTGLIAAGEPHLHIALATPDGRAFGGHLENGCKVLYVAEVTLARFSGPQLARQPNRNKIPMLVAR
jgi:predicted DNA-binding protein with PD1-like motif